MPDEELRSALLRFFQDQSAQIATLLKALEGGLEQVPEGPSYDALEGQVKFVLKLQQSSRQLLGALGPAVPAIVSEPPAAEATSVELREPDPFVRDLVAAYNERTGNWNRTYKPSGFGAENVNEIWGTGGEPRFAKKEGGIYNLVEADGTCYVVPEPGLRLQESYVRSEGLLYLFNVTGNSTEQEPLIALIDPAKVEEAGGRWNIISKGEIRGRA